MKMYREWAELYDLLYGAQGQNRDIHFLTGLIKEYGGPVLECACGTGRVMIPVAENGLAVHGIDTSRDMLRVLEKKLPDLHEDVRKRISYEMKDMRDFKLDSKFRTCFIAFNSLYHLQNDREISDFFRCVNSNLEKGGVLIIDVFDFDPETPQGKFALQAKVKGSKGKTISKYHKTVFGRNQINNCTFRIVVEGKVEKKEIQRHFRLHYLFHDQMWKLLEKEGFKILRVYGNYDSEPYHEGKQNEKMVFVARKI